MDAQLPGATQPSVIFSGSALATPATKTAHRFAIANFRIFARIACSSLDEPLFYRETAMSALLNDDCGRKGRRGATPRPTVTSGSINFDICSFNDGPPFVGFRLLKGTKCLRRLQIARGDLLPELVE